MLVPNGVRYRGVPLYISGKRGMRNWAVEHNVAMFSELSLAVCWRERLKRG